MGKIIYKCEFGVVHREGNCRCTSDHVDYRQIKCNSPRLHGGASTTVNDSPGGVEGELQAETEKPEQVEYRTFMLSVGSEDPYLNSLAQQGWRVVGYSVQYPKSYFVLERKK